MVSGTWAASAPSRGCGPVCAVDATIMRHRSMIRALAFGCVLALAPFASGCGDEAGQGTDNITDVNHTDVERQSIGNCWLYAHASWIESMNLSATGVPF